MKGSIEIEKDTSIDTKVTCKQGSKMEEKKPNGHRTGNWIWEREGEGEGFR
jgi:hypothetical protein